MPLNCPDQDHEHADNPPASCPEPCGANTQPSSGEPITRRRFLQACTAGAGLAVAAAGGYVAYRFLKPDASLDSPADFVLGKPEDLSEGRIFVAEAKAFVERAGARVRCMSAVCTHLGCLVKWDEAMQRYRCPCHGSDFMPDGTNPTGPASKPLPFFRLSRDADGRVIAHRKQVLAADGAEWLDLG
ncbi:MAG: Rieske 2Fe-2S domain-containing protein [Planctomycetes bacterium]|nr:Rieske 2Fe-2S domain-containing protein [Planctomycetota bacterium]